jgi:tetratricopeptide (TPR) repeat protein
MATLQPSLEILPGRTTINLLGLNFGGTVFGKVLWIAACLAGLAGCAAVPNAPSPTQLPWHDQTFAYDAALVSVQKEDLFRLDPVLVQKLQDPALKQLSTPMRLDHLVRLIYGSEMKPFPYTAGHSTVAAETWQQRRGDCLSLTVLAFSMAREMNMVSQMQEVRVPVWFDRHDSVDFLSEHVNVLFRRSGPLNWTEGRLQSDDMIVDFEPQIGSNREGQPLSDSAILSRYYNNIGAEHLVNARQQLAYAYFKAAILAEPRYPSSYNNLALLYRRAGLQADAEQLLRHAVALSHEATVPLSSLHQLLLEQGRNSEADEYARLLQSRREQDPYYWIGLGLQRLQSGNIRQSIQALEEAQRLTHGFAEIHRYLALAYWRAGEQAHADEQLTLLASLNRDGADVATLRKKFNTSNRVRTRSKPTSEF